MYRMLEITTIYSKKQHLNKMGFITHLQKGSGNNRIVRPQFVEKYSYNPWLLMSQTGLVPVTFSVYLATLPPCYHTCRHGRIHRRANSDRNDRYRWTNICDQAKDVHTKGVRDWRSCNCSGKESKRPSSPLIASTTQNCHQMKNDHSIGCNSASIPMRSMSLRGHYNKPLPAEMIDSLCLPFYHQSA